MVIANLKSLGLDMIDNASSGHPGIVLSAAPIIYTVYAKHMHINPKDSNWINRDRFIMSAGHGSALLYSTLYMAGFISLGDLKNFRRLDSRTPGHPEYGTTPGVDASTGPLGQGIGTAVGMAIAEKHLETKFKNIINYNIYVLCGDGDLMEGISYEAASLAGTLNLNNLIVLYDSNNISLDGNINLTFTENVRERFEALGWYTALVKDGTKPSEINKAINRAKKSGLPSFIEVKTILGKDSLLENTNNVHGKPLTKEDISNIKHKLNIKDEPFYVNDEAIKSFRKEISERSCIKYQKWQKDYNDYKINSSYNELNTFLNNDVDFDISIENININKKDTLINSNNYIMNIVDNHTDLLFGGSADVFSSTKTYLNEKQNFKKDNYLGKNIWFGVREHLMGAVLNGLALSGFRSYGSTFLSFSDYLKPAIRMSALMNLPVTYIFTHDSIYNSYDGPTHQPVEQLSALRNIPNFTVYRPADIKEVLGAWKCILKRKEPSALILSREETYTLNTTSDELVSNGAYIVKHEHKKIDAILLATGKEVETAIIVAYALLKEGIDIRIVSMPSVELFKKQNLKYRNEILPAGKKVIVLEAARSLELREFVSHNRYLIILEEFGQSGTKDEVAMKFNFSTSKIIERVRKLI